MSTRSIHHCLLRVRWLGARTGLRVGLAVASSSAGCYAQHFSAESNGDRVMVQGAAQAGSAAAAPVVSAPASGGVAEVSATIVSEDAGVDDCQTATVSMVGPTSALLGMPAQFSANALDDSALAYDYVWSASGGELSDLTGSLTTFTCTKPGLHSVTLTVMRGLCTNALASPIRCFELE